MAFAQFYISFKNQDGKLVHSHSSLVEDSKAAEIKAVHSQFHPVRNGLTFFCGYVALEAVNRLPKFTSMPHWQRAAVVLASAAVASQVVEPVFWLSSGNAQLQQLMVGQPVFENKRDVPELDKAFFFLDDDNNYEPSLMHHGLTALSRNFSLYTNEKTV